jgi:hypothetical protein
VATLEQDDGMMNRIRTVLMLLAALVVEPHAVLRRGV